MVSSEDVLEAMSEFDPEVEVENIDDISGENRETYDVETSSGEHFICCFGKFKPGWFKIEESLIELVNKETGIPTQNIVYSDLSRDELPELFHISEKIAGSKSEDEYADLPVQDKIEVVRQIGRYLAEIHENIQFQNFGRLRFREGSLEVEESSWKELVQEIAEEYIDGMKGTPFEDLQVEMRNYVQMNLHLLDESDPLLVHYDVAVDNIVRQGTEVKAVLDWERAFAGRPEWDLAHLEVRFILQFLGDEEKIERLQEALFGSYQEVRHLERGWRTRKEFYGMIQLFHGMKYFENWTERKNYSEEEILKDKEWHRQHFKENNKRLEH
jgi:aminoglycoside phosphotransferase (APT) family kinase protein